MTDKAFFTRRLLEWNRKTNRRSMPWKGEKNPYKIWLSEIILQQTRVEQGQAYYERFVDRFPDIKKLAAAPDEEVFKLWEGLGYYTRCRNLLAAARQVARDFKGRFPSAYSVILALPGIGPYTAAAIASFAFNLPHAVVDGNVYRVLARFFGIETPIDSTEGKKAFNQLAGELLHSAAPGTYNQAIMDFGATQCTPRSPNCSVCPLAARCRALADGQTDSLPVKAKTILRHTRWLYYALFARENGFYTRKRTGRDIWAGLYEFALLEAENEMSEQALRQFDWKKLVKGVPACSIAFISAPYRQQLTHRDIESRFIILPVNQPLPPESGLEWVAEAGLKHLSFPRIIRHFLDSGNHKTGNI